MLKLSLQRVRFYSWLSDLPPVLASYITMVLELPRHVCMKNTRWSSKQRSSVACECVFGEATFFHHLWLSNDPAPRVYSTDWRLSCNKWTAVALCLAKVFTLLMLFSVFQVQWMPIDVHNMHTTLQVWSGLLVDSARAPILAKEKQPHATFTMLQQCSFSDGCLVFAPNISYWYNICYLLLIIP